MRETESEAKGKIKCIGFIMRSEEKREGKRREEKEERGPTLKGVLRKKWPCLGIFSVWWFVAWWWCRGSRDRMWQTADKEGWWDGWLAMRERESIRNRDRRKERKTTTAVPIRKEGWAPVWLLFICLSQQCLCWGQPDVTASPHYLIDIKTQVDHTNLDSQAILHQRDSPWLPRYKINT